MRLEALSFDHDVLKGGAGGAQLSKGLPEGRGLDRDNIAASAEPRDAEELDRDHK